MGLGVSVAWFVMSLLSGQLDLKGAWHALRKKP
jgi:hypothetical protein